VQRYFPMIPIAMQMEMMQMKIIITAAVGYILDGFNYRGIGLFTQQV
jgi:hypothetical protein